MVSLVSSIKIVNYNECRAFVSHFEHGRESSQCVISAHFGAKGYIAPFPHKDMTVSIVKTVYWTCELVYSIMSYSGSGRSYVS